MTYLPLNISEYENKSIDLLFRLNSQDKYSQTALSGYLICDDEETSFTYQQCQTTIDKIAKEFMLMGLAEGDILAMQLPNSIESNLVTLACFQSGIIIAAIPEIWRKSEVEQALIRISPQALICPKIHDGFDYSEHMYEVAFNISSIRHLLSLGGNPADGCIALDHCFDQDANNALQIMRPDDYLTVQADKTCFISFQKDKIGMSIPIEHSHINLVTHAFKFYSEIANPKNQTLVTPFANHSLLVCATNLVAFSIFDFKLHCLSDLNATELQSLNVEGNILFLPKSLDSDALSDALFDQKCDKIVFLSKFSNAENSLQINENIIDLISLEEFGFIAHNRAANLKLEDQISFQYMLNQVEIELDKLIVKDNQWVLNSSNFPNNKTSDSNQINLNLSNNDRLKNDQSHYNIGGVKLNFDDVEAALKQYHGVDDAAILLFEDAILTYKAVIAIVPKMGAVILEHEIHSFLKNKQIASHKIGQDVYEIPEIKRDYDGNVLRLTSKEALLGAKGPIKQNDDLVQIQQELATLIAANS